MADKKFAADIRQMAGTDDDGGFIVRRQCRCEWKSDYYAMNSSTAAAATAAATAAAAAQVSEADTYRNQTTNKLLTVLNDPPMQSYAHCREAAIRRSRDSAICILDTTRRHEARKTRSL
jgi:hypothetical protein